ncbi:MAG: hypothetical protein HYU69_02695 [Bacteroidetes bacterium]|nr:hypothetical protein [Bacteroidota bacterium]
MSKNSELFNLVKSLSSSEKRYFKLQASVFRENDSLLSLFDLLDRQQKYDAKEVLKEFKSKKKDKQLSDTKNRLNNLILKSMRAYNVARSVDNQLNVMFQNINFLLQKKLLRQAEMELLKVERLATLHEKFNYLLEAIGLRWNYFNTDVKTMYATHEEVIRKINNAAQYHLMLGTLAEAIAKTGTVVRDQNKIKKIKQSVNNPLFKDERKAFTNYSKIYYFLTQFFYYRTIGDMRSAYKMSARFVKYLEDQPAFINQNPNAYRSALNNYLVSQLDNRKFNDFYECIDKLRLIADNYPNANNHEFVNAVQLRVFELMMEYYLVTMQLNEGMRLIPEIESWLDQLKAVREPGIEITICMSIVQLLFMASKYTDALKWLNRILNQSHENYAIVKDVHALARIMDLLIHYEIENVDLLEYRLRSAERFLVKEERHFKFESEIILFFKKNLHQFSEKDRMKKELNILKDKLNKIVKDPLEQQFLNYFDFNSWIESKILDRPFAEVLQEKTM